MRTERTLGQLDHARVVREKQHLRVLGQLPQHLERRRRIRDQIPYAGGQVQAEEQHQAEQQQRWRGGGETVAITGGAGARRRPTLESRE